ncbi:ethanolamine ammonia-lyase subunit EutC [Nocardia cyriacigeorgica]|uniref:Ethanolamine ammonia-lyase small subunit n=1 Tax=Nocardia cyriacigeorgica TaxID=135487 RepID=A0ABX0CDP7_9NOCA|nr:ethanolamine ammonia-lyase subunit EutC [Nocardia cyriacigeorgica]NEW54679.1 ethanolamine ammonia-lyase subunit EutC [Nocardia cyriacigeorgica]
MSGDHPPADSDDQRQFWTDLRATTQARIGLGRAGNALPTAHVLEFRAAHAAARDAVHTPLDVDALHERIVTMGLGEPLRVRSRARDRAEYLRRPDLGRLPGESWPFTGDDDRASASDSDTAEIGIVLADGLSPSVLLAHGPAMVAALITEFGPRASFAPPVIATQARVALGDHIAVALGVATVLVLIGERPGLSVADSLGVYLTHQPRLDCADADRNCVSNIHRPNGLGYRQAARVVVGLVAGARRLGRSGVDLKDLSGPDLTSAEPAVLPDAQP